MAVEHMAQRTLTDFFVEQKLIEPEWFNHAISYKRITLVVTEHYPEVLVALGKQKLKLEDLVGVCKLLGIPVKERKRGKPPVAKPAQEKIVQKPTRKSKAKQVKKEKRERKSKQHDFLTNSKYKTLTNQAKKHLDYDFIISSEFLNSVEWKRLRFVALSSYDRKCVCCGATPESGAVLNVDHIKPRRLFPELALELDNLQILCADCNQGKGNLSTKRF